MIRQQAFTGERRRMLKGNLHAHTTRSDGWTTPEELIRLYRERGYDFLALTDHRFYNLKSFAPDEDILVVPGMELDYTLPQPGPECRHATHIVCLGPREGNGLAQDQRFERYKVVDQFELQGHLDELHARGNLTVLAHPQWSSTSFDEFRYLQGNFAMEIWNTCSVHDAACDSDAAYWDFFLREGKRIYGVAVDDCHRPEHFARSFVMVNAPRDVPAILNALNEGAFYASTGPVIEDFYYDGGRAVVKCSPACQIRFHFGFSPTHIVRANDALLKGAVFDVPDCYTYIRASVVDPFGNKAWTNPIFLKEV
ncbi:MAG: hypothetical protein E7317_09900 [Clostridiales bacterium]|nr:hypothetical protein [Clostridiales bacterium]